MNSLALSKSVPLFLAALSLVGCGGGGSGDSLDSQEPGLSGTITIESGTRVDSDTADDSRLNEAVSNDSSSTAQLIPSTGILGAISVPPLVSIRILTGLYLSMSSTARIHFAQIWQRAARLPYRFSKMQVLPSLRLHFPLSRAVPQIQIREQAIRL